MALRLNDLPAFANRENPPPPPMLSLATRNLLRGRLVGLPTGQQAAKALRLAPLTAAELSAGASADQVDALRRHGFFRATPLWYYILREAAVQQEGQRLGEVGSTIVVETFIGLIESTPGNVLEDGPIPNFTMPDLLREVGDLNPLG